MPTGYTAAIKDDITFKTFVKNCARAFGAYVEFRDEPMDKNVDEDLQISPFYKEKIEETEKELQRVKSLSDEECIKEQNLDIEDIIKRYDEYDREKIELKAKYENMLNKVKSWEPPTEDHTNLKKFMIEQIEQSIDFDCSFYTRDIPKHKSASEWKENMIQCLEHDVEYYKNQYQKDVDNYNSRKKWINELNESLKNEN